jgi:3-isopropylmalate/(R)-2-methylmalate dehydratase large subunit
MLEEGLIHPGMLVAGADSHTMTIGAMGAIGYGIGATDLAALWALGEIWIDVPPSRKFILSGKPPKYTGGKDVSLLILGMLGQEGAMHEAVEFEGGAFGYLSMADRITIANMSAEAGAATSVVVQDEVSRKWLQGRGVEEFNPVTADPDADYVKVHEIDISEMSPMVAVPDDPSDAHPIGEIEDVAVDQVFVGSCASGTIDDIRRFVEIVGDRKFNSQTRVIVIPATQDTFKRAMAEGLIAKIVEAGGAVETASCGPCLGGYGGVLGSGEVCLSTTNRNFKGRMGHPDSRVYLAGPEVAGATAVTGKITHPAEVAG